ncbi:hypothetical protein BDN67DRAFT_1014792 [Paxillus ammoniavirescens]|nr:hypothetical protein BDN67DRAFT_1014792 [Paxillus ammoniavirescens]
MRRLSQRLMNILDTVQNAQIVTEAEIHILATVQNAQIVTEVDEHFGQCPKCAELPQRLMNILDIVQNAQIKTIPYPPKPLHGFVGSPLKVNTSTPPGLSYLILSACYRFGID